MQVARKKGHGGSAFLRAMYRTTAAYGAEMACRVARGLLQMIQSSMRRKFPCRL